MNRGQVITVTLKGNYGKPRPALIVQSDFFDEHPSITILPITSELRDTPLFRYPLTAHQSHGLSKDSQVMIDKITTIKREKAGQVIGQLNQKQLTEITRLLALWLGMD